MKIKFESSTISAGSRREMKSNGREKVDEKGGRRYVGNVLLRRYKNVAD